MIISPEDIAKLGNFLPKLIGFVGAARLLPDPDGPIADFVNAHPSEIALFEKVSDFFFPGAGGIEAFLILALEYSHPMDEAESRLWMQRQEPQG